MHISFIFLLEAKQKFWSYLASLAHSEILRGNNSFVCLLVLLVTFVEAWLSIPIAMLDRKTKSMVAVKDFRPMATATAAKVWGKSYGYI